MIAGKFSGVGYSGSPGGLTLDNVPKSAFPQAYWDLKDYQCDAPIYDGTFNLILSIGGPTNDGSSCFHSIPSLNRQEARALDKKIDDGSANSGKMYGDGMDNCLDAGSDYYQAIVTPDARDCILYFVLK